MTDDRYIVTPQLLKRLAERGTNSTLFRLPKSLYSRSDLFKRANNFNSDFSKSFGSWILRDPIPDAVRFLFSIFNLSCDFNFSFDAQNLLLIRDCNNVITLPVSG
jgi:hypothetical protein